MSQNEWTASSPTRIDLAGGTLDLWPLAHILRSRFQGQAPVARTINVGLQKRTECHLKFICHSKDTQTRGDLKVRLSDESAGGTYLFPSEIAKITEVFPLVAQVLVGMKAEILSGDWSELELSTGSEVPRGSGLGGSSSVFVSVLGAFYNALGKPLQSEANWVDLCQHACNLEAGLLGGLAGIQDHLGAAFGGISSYHFEGHQISRKAMPHEALNWIEEHCLLALAPEVHHSGNANWGLIKSLFEQDEKSLHLFKEIAENAADMEACLLAKEFSKVPKLMSNDWQLRKSAVPNLTTPNIEKLDAASKKAGASGFKVCGAAAGGMALVSHSGGAKGRNEMKKTLESEGFKVMLLELSRFGFLQPATSKKAL